FSSRRRHTRSYGDWSSDVCSSDLLKYSIVQGVVSARREFEGVEMIQLAIPIEPGNSGGPLLDMQGRVNGLLTMKSAMSPNLGFEIGRASCRERVEIYVGADAGE